MKVDGTGRLTRRNRRYLRKFTLPDHTQLSCSPTSDGGQPVNIPLTRAAAAAQQGKVVLKPDRCVLDAGNTSVPAPLEDKVETVGQDDLTPPRVVNPMTGATSDVEKPATSEEKTSAIQAAPPPPLEVEAPAPLATPPPLLSTSPSSVDAPPSDLVGITYKRERKPPKRYDAQSGH